MREYLPTLIDLDFGKLRFQSFANFVSFLSAKRNLKSYENSDVGTFN